MRSSRTCWVVAWAAAVLLAGCDDGPTSDAPGPTESAATPVKPPPIKLPPEMVAAVSSTRNSAIVSVHFSLKGIPTVDSALPVDIAIVPHDAFLAVSAHFEAREGIVLVAGNSLDRQADPVPNKLINHQLVLLPKREGVFTVTAVIETVTGEGAVSRVFSIPVIVTLPGATPAAEPPAAPSVAPPASG